MFFRRTPFLIIALNICIFFIIGCESLPEDLQIRKDAINAKLLELSNLDKNPVSSEYNKLLKDYMVIKEEVVSYTNECINRGISKNNNDLIKELEAKITKYENLIKEEDRKLEEEKESTTICSICGREFTGLGYHEVSEGVWELCNEPYQCQICSRKCGMKHTGKWDEIMNEVDKMDNSASTRLCKNCKFGVYRGGFCDLCGAATAEKVQEYKNRLPKCDLCKGTGIETPIGLSSGDGRICPACDGSGHVSY